MKKKDQNRKKWSFFVSFDLFLFRGNWQYTYSYCMILLKNWPTYLNLLNLPKVERAPSDRVEIFLKIWKNFSRKNLSKKYASRFESEILRGSSFFIYFLRLLKEMFKSIESIEFEFNFDIEKKSKKFIGRIERWRK